MVKNESLDDLEVARLNKSIDNLSILRLTTDTDKKLRELLITEKLNRKLAIEKRLAKCL